MARRKIIEIVEELCNGCGQCIPSCAEGALQIVDGKARLVADVYCDGLGACLGECPRDAIRLVEREADTFDMEAAKKRLAQLQESASPANRPAPPNHTACPGAVLVDLTDGRPEILPGRPGGLAASVTSSGANSNLRNWPLQLHLVPPTAPFLRNAELLLVADCVPFAMGDFHARLLDGSPVVIGCPKLDDTGVYLEKLAAIISTADTPKMTVVHMDVPCCAGLVRLAQAARQRTGRDIPLADITISVRGEGVANPAE